MELLRALRLKAMIVVSIMGRLLMAGVIMLVRGT